MFLWKKNNCQQKNVPSVSFMPFLSVFLYGILGVFFVNGSSVFVFSASPETSSLCAEESSEVFIKEVRWGIHSDADTGGVWKPGRWMPIYVFFRTEAEGQGDVQEKKGEEKGKILRCFIKDCDGVTAIYEKKLFGGLPQCVEMCVQAGNIYSGVMLELYDGEGNLLQQKSFPRMNDPLNEARGVILVVGKSTAGAELAVEHLNLPGRLRPLVYHITSAERLPSDPGALEIVDTVIILTEDDTILNTWTQEKVDILEEWMRRGGTLLLSVGKNGKKVVSREDLWGRFLPQGAEVEMLTMPQTTALEHFAHSTVPVPLLGVTEEYRIIVPRMARQIPLPRMDVSRMLFSQYDLPLAFRSTCDFGRFVCVLFDLEHDAVKKWGDRGKLLANLLGFPEKSTAKEKPVSSGKLYGYDDLAGQFRSALDQFSGLRTCSFAWLILLFAGYLVVIGPLGYYFARKYQGNGTRIGAVLSSAGFSWVFFISMVFVFSALCYFLSQDMPASESSFSESRSENAFSGTYVSAEFSDAHASERNKIAGSVRMNRVTLVDICQNTGRIRQTLWGNIWNSRTGHFTLRFAGNDILSKHVQGELPVNKISSEHGRKEECRMGCFGLPGAFLGGMTSRTHMMGKESFGLNDAYLVSSGQWKRLPMIARSTKSISAQRMAVLPSEEKPYFGFLHARGDIPYGEIQNPLDVSLENCMLAYGGWAYDLGTLAPGEKIQINDHIRRYDLPSMLVESEMVGEKMQDIMNYRRVTRPYDRSSRDLSYILRAMMFHASTGGNTYTGLRHDYCSWTDCSSILRDGTAVFCGTVLEGEENAFFSDIHIYREGEQKTKMPLDFKVGQDKRLCVLRGYLPVKQEQE
ncbi:MAG: hypothetical protein Q4C96_05640 [Planctomycetia bacterium]|nr:hypothetical protein [Planctomycetia bacterium]